MPSRSRCKLRGPSPSRLAAAAIACVARGAQIVDINMGCPAKKVLKKLAGSALMRDESRVADILRAVVTLPLTFPCRSKSAPDGTRTSRNAVNIARIAEDVGVVSLAVHGRTRACRYKGDAEYATIAAVKHAVKIPVIANGDITSLKKSLEVLRVTNCDGLMIGRGAQGRPWIFRDLLRQTETTPTKHALDKTELRDIMLGHLGELHRFYGDTTGVRVARKHLAWYCNCLTNADEFRHRVVRVESASEQIRLTRAFFAQQDVGIADADWAA